MLGDEEHELGEAGRSYLGVIRRGTTRLQRIVEDLLLVAQIEADRLELDPVETDLAELATEAVAAALPSAAEQGIELVLDAMVRFRSKPMPAGSDRCSTTSSRTRSSSRLREGR
jgi:Signal transduction histidine kinase